MNERQPLCAITTLESAGMIEACFCEGVYTIFATLAVGGRVERYVCMYICVYVLAESRMVT